MSCCNQGSFRYVRHGQAAIEIDKCCSRRPSKMHDDWQQIPARGKICKGNKTQGSCRSTQHGNTDILFPTFRIRRAKRGTPEGLRDIGTNERHRQFWESPHNSGIIKLRGDKKSFPRVDGSPNGKSPPGGSQQGLVSRREYHIVAVLTRAGQWRSRIRIQIAGSHPGILVSVHTTWHGNGRDIGTKGEHVRDLQGSQGSSTHLDKKEVLP